MVINDEIVLAAIVFGLIKLVGYFYLAAWVGRFYRPQRVASPLIVALSRIALGALFAWLVASAVHVERSLPWYLVLVVLRGVEWGLVFWYFYERRAENLDPKRLLMFAGFGALVSCVLDLPAAFSAFVLPLMVYGIC